MDINPHGKARSKRSTILDPKLNILCTLMLGDSSTPTVREREGTSERGGDRTFYDTPIAGQYRSFMNVSFYCVFKMLRIGRHSTCDYG